LKKYRFEMEGVLNYRTLIEQHHQERVSTARHELLVQEQRLQQLYELKNAAAQQNIDQADLFYLQQLDNYRLKMDELITSQVEKVKRHENKVEACLDALAVATTERKVMEKLKDKSFKRFCRQLFGLEQKMLDEMGLFAFRGIAE
jgi:flagellar FliJ protein